LRRRRRIDVGVGDDVDVDVDVDVEKGEDQASNWDGKGARVWVVGCSAGT
jgi:hypothetical protein